MMLIESGYSLTCGIANDYSEGLVECWHYMQSHVLHDRGMDCAYGWLRVPWNNYYRETEKIWSILR
jgi:hypothetical protein